MENQIASVLFGLSSALVWGAGDFCGGLGSRRAPIISVLFLAETSGLVLLLIAGIAFHEALPSPVLLGWAVGAGLLGTLGLGALYRGLAVGKASIVAPLSAVISSILPAVFSALTIGLPEPVQLLGFAIAIAAIVLISQAGREEGEGNALGYAVVAGLGFGGFFILIHLAGGENTTFMPLAVARAVTIPLLLVLGLLRRTVLPTRVVMPVIILSGLLDASGNVLFLVSSALGRLDVATILSSLYPASTVILSRVILHETISRMQQLGVVLALVAIVLIAL